MLTSLSTRPDTSQRYVELSHVGHCPNHEAPQAVARILHRWVMSFTTTTTTNNNNNNNKDKEGRRSKSPVMLVMTTRDTKSSLPFVETKEEEEEVIQEPWGDIHVREVCQEEANQLSLWEKLVLKMVT